MRDDKKKVAYYTKGQITLFIVGISVIILALVLRYFGIIPPK